MEDKIKKLIAIGASVSANCHSCLEHHVGEARTMGLEEADIQDAIHVGQTVRRGAGSSLDKLAESLMQGKSANSGMSTMFRKGCCC